MSSSWDMVQRWSRTRLGRKYVNLDTLSPLPGVVDGHNCLSGNLRHVGATADRGLALASQLSASRDQFIQSMESQQEEMMTVLAQKQKSFWESMRCQIAEQEKTIAAIKPRQNDALKELQDQDTGLQMTRQTLSPVPSLGWDYREGALRAQHDQLLTKQEALGSLHTSTPVEERTHLEHPIEGVPGGVSAVSKRILHHAGHSPGGVSWCLPTWSLWHSALILHIRKLDFRSATGMQVIRWGPGTHSGMRLTHHNIGSPDHLTTRRSSQSWDKMLNLLWGTRCRGFQLE